MTSHILQIGDVITVQFPEQSPQGREQEGYRPIVVGLPSRLGALRFPLIFVAPMTTDRGQKWIKNSPVLYVRFDAGIAGLKTSSVVLLDSDSCNRCCPYCCISRQSHARGICRDR
jgi:mRNA interferase MazF